MAYYSYIFFNLCKKNYKLDMILKVNALHVFLFLSVTVDLRFLYYLCVYEHVYDFYFT